MSFWGLLLFLGACVGHAGILIHSLNWWYGHGVPHKVLAVIRFVHFFLIAAGNAAFAVLFGVSFDGWGQAHTAPWQVVLDTYLPVCWLVGFGFLPLVTAARLLRKPAALLQNHTETIDVAAALGCRPVGRGKHRYMAYLPGNDIFRVDFAEKALRLPRLPHAWNGLTILHISDLHMCGTPDRAFFEHVADRCRAWEPDIVAITGDTVDSSWHHRWVLPVLGRLKWRIAAFAILGNHEAWYDPQLIRRRLTRTGIKVIGNGWCQVDVRGQPLIVLGNETPWFRPQPDLQRCPGGTFRLCLSHSPDNIRWAQKNKVDLMLAGHVHGGQVRFPILGSVLVPSRHSRRYDAGTFNVGQTVLHVSRGIGGQHPIRLNCRPEVAMLRLH
jgi:predicted MPP superfamily phosphohydrolase